MSAWDVYYASLCGWLLHPGYLRDGAVRPTLEDIADLVDQMIEIRNARLEE